MICGQFSRVFFFFFFLFFGCINCGYLVCLNMRCRIRFNVDVVVCLLKRQKNGGKMNEKYHCRSIIILILILSLKNLRKKYIHSFSILSTILLAHLPLFIVCSIEEEKKNLMGLCVLVMNELRMRCCHFAILFTNNIISFYQ